jgi:hypothetical protein
MTLKQHLDRWLVEDWTRAHRWLSVQIATAILIWSQLSEEKQAAILGLIGWTPDNLVGVLALSTIVGRLLSQGRAVALTPPKDPS